MIGDPVTHYGMKSGRIMSAAGETNHRKGMQMMYKGRGIARGDEWIAIILEE